MSPYILILLPFTFLLLDQSLSQPTTPIQPPLPKTIAPIQQPQPTGAAGIVVLSPAQPLTTTNLPPMPPLTPQPASAPSPVSHEVRFCKVQIKQKDDKLVWQSIDGTIVDMKCDDQDTSELAPLGLGAGGAAAPGFGLAPESSDSSSGQVSSRFGPQQQSLNEAESGPGFKLPGTSTSNKQLGVGAKNGVENGAEEMMAAVGVVLTSAVVVSLMAGFGLLF